MLCIVIDPRKLHKQLTILPYATFLSFVLVPVRTEELVVHRRDTPRHFVTTETFRRHWGHKCLPYVGTLGLKSKHVVSLRSSTNGSSRKSEAQTTVSQILTR